MAVAYPDVRRPTQYEATLQALTGEIGIFDTMRDALVFCSALGFSRGRREEFSPHPNAIAWSTMAGNQLFEQLLLMITASTSRDNPEQLGDEAVRERVKAFEEYACGGLAILSAEIGRGLEAEVAVLAFLGKEISDLNAFDPFDGGSAIFDPFV
jgi:dnd system-associated protein 4